MGLRRTLRHVLSAALRNCELVCLRIVASDA